MAPSPVHPRPPADRLHFCVVALGSHGDVHPLLGIALELQRRGHDVRFFTSAHFKPLLEQCGIPYDVHGTDEEFQTLMHDKRLWHPLKALRAVFELGVWPLIVPVHDWVLAHYRPGRTHVIAHPLAIGALTAQEKHGVPVTTVQLAPMAIRSAHHPGAPMDQLMYRWMPLGLKRGIWSLFDHAILDRSTVPGVNVARKQLGLPPVKRVIDDTWLSPRRVLGLWPDWYGPVQPDWPEQVRLTGFPLWDERTVGTLSDELRHFLDIDDPPLAFTAGSAMVQGHRFFQTAADTCHKLGRRGLLLTRHPKQLPDTLPPGVIHVPYAPFSQLLPRVACLTHHGGIGTTAQCLAAGCPQLVVPMAHDQPDNARRITTLGCGRQLLPQLFRPTLAARTLASVLSDETNSRCREIATRLNHDHGVPAAADQLEQDARDLPVDDQSKTALQANRS